MNSDATALDNHMTVDRRSTEDGGGHGPWA